MKGWRLKMTDAWEITKVNEIKHVACSGCDERLLACNACGRPFIRNEDIVCFMGDSHRHKDCVKFVSD